MNERDLCAGGNTVEGMFERVVVGKGDREILQLEAHLRAAQIAGDVEALSQLISDDLLFAGPDGSLATKSMDIDSHRSGLVKFLRHEPLELHIRRSSPTTAVVSLAARLLLSVNGQSHQGVFRYLRVWHYKDDSGWQVLAGQVGKANGSGDSTPT